MRLIGKLEEFDRKHVTLAIDGDYKTIESFKELSSDKVVLEVSKYHKKRSKSANAYLWELVSMIAEKLNTDRETIYLWMIKDAGVMVSMTVIEDAIPNLEKVFRLVEVNESYDGYVDVKCYYGSSTYDSKEMARLIDYTRQEALDLGCDVYTDEEMRALYDTTSNYKKTSN